MAIKYLFTDMDGTLLDERHQVSDRTRRVIARLKEKGVEVVLCSARPPAAMVDIARDAGASSRMICCAGAVICDGEDILESVHVPIRVARRVREAVRDTAVSLNLYLDFHWYVQEPDEWSLSEAAIVGFLATASCSHHMPRALLEQALLEASLEAGVQLKLVESRGQSPDHPVLLGVPETEYLKFYIFQVV